eukprot:6205830-Pleurochrysis_carterae.AAC.3
MDDCAVIPRRSLHRGFPTLVLLPITFILTRSRGSATVLQRNRLPVVNLDEKTTWQNVRPKTLEKAINFLRLNLSNSLLHNSLGGSLLEPVWLFVLVTLTGYVNYRRFVVRTAKARWRVHET